MPDGQSDPRSERIQAVSWRQQLQQGDYGATFTRPEAVGLSVLGLLLESGLYADDRRPAGEQV